MKIENNIIKHHLKNVYFIGGTACGGKTTISKVLAEKYGFYLYDQDKQYDIHRSIANTEYQPAMCYRRQSREDWECYFSRSVDEYTKWMGESLHEQSKMVIMDLIKISANQTVIADVLFEPYDIDGIVENDHIVFLTSIVDLIRECYFNRPEKRDFYDFVSTFDKKDEYFENIFHSLEVGNHQARQRIEASNYFSILRTKSSTIENTLQQVEHHFKLR